MRISIRGTTSEKEQELLESVLPKEKGTTLPMTAKEAQYFLLGYTSKTTAGQRVRLHKANK